MDLSWDNFNSSVQTKTHILNGYVGFQRQIPIMKPTITEPSFRSLNSPPTKLGRRFTHTSKQVFSENSWCFFMHLINHSHNREEAVAVTFARTVWLLVIENSFLTCNTAVYKSFWYFKLSQQKWNKDYCRY